MKRQKLHFVVVGHGDRPVPEYAADAPYAVIGHTRKADAVADARRRAWRIHGRGYPTRFGVLSLALGPTQWVTGYFRAPNDDIDRICGRPEVLSSTWVAP